MQGCVTVPEFFISDKISFPLVDRLKIKQMLQQLSHTHTNIKNMSVLSRRKHHIFSVNMWQLASSVSAKLNRTKIDLWMPTLLQVIIKKKHTSKDRKNAYLPLTMSQYKNAFTVFAFCHGDHWAPQTPSQLILLSSSERLTPQFHSSPTFGELALACVVPLFLLFRLWESFQGCRRERVLSSCTVDFPSLLPLNAAPPLSSVSH